MGESFLNIKRNQIEMVKARGYDVEDDLWILDSDLTFKNFKKKLIKKYGDYPIRKLMFSEYTKEGSKSLFVFFVGLQEGKQIKLEAIDPFIHKMVEEDKEGLLIINSVLSPSALKRLSIITESKYQIFQEYEFDFNLINHFMVPKHQLLTTEEANVLRKKLNFGPKGIPILPHNDVISQYYNFPVGGIVKIMTENDTDILYNHTVEYCVVV